MLRSILKSTGTAVRDGLLARTRTGPVTSLRSISRIDDSDETELICKYEVFFNRPDIDGWEVRKAMEDLHGMDYIPDPKIIVAGLKACRRLNDYALAIRFLEAVRFKSSVDLKKYWGYIVQEIRPTLSELGIETPEELCYDRPELWKCNVYEIH